MKTEINNIYGTLKPFTMRDTSFEHSGEKGIIHVKVDPGPGVLPTFFMSFWDKYVDLKHPNAIENEETKNSHK